MRRRRADSRSAPTGPQASMRAVTIRGCWSASSGTSGVVYQPLANQYYQWVDTATLTRPVTSTAADYGWTFSGVSANSPTYPYTQTTSLVSNVQQVVNGVATGQLQTANFQEVVTATGGYHSNNFNTSSGAVLRQYQTVQLVPADLRQPDPDADEHGQGLLRHRHSLQRRRFQLGGGNVRTPASSSTDRSTICRAQRPSPRRAPIRPLRSARPPTIR